MTTTTRRRASSARRAISTGKTSSRSSPDSPRRRGSSLATCTTFFVADEPQVPAWEQMPPRDPSAIESLMRVYMESNGDMRAILRALFNSDFFKTSQSRKVKSPTELVAGVIKLVGTHRFPRPGMLDYAGAVTLMGQSLFDPPTVEGWHTGKEWDRRRDAERARQLRGERGFRRDEAGDPLHHRQD